MKTKRVPVFELVLFCIILIAFYAIGYFFFLQSIKSKIPFSNREYFQFSVIFVIAFVAMVLFFSQSLKNMNKAIDEKLEIQKTYLEQLNNTYEGTLKALSYALDVKDHGTWGHSARVVGYALAIAEKIGLAKHELQQLAWAGLLHDIGKIGIPDSILLKKTALNQEEWDNIKRHPQIGYEVIREINFLKFAADIVLSHHEHYNGLGYPKGIKGDKIPLGARIFAVADALDAMTSDRPYRKAIPMEEAISEIKRLAGEQFCPKCVAALEKMEVVEFYRIQQQVKNISDIANLRNGLDPLIAFTQIDYY